jgi:hypothetical protein
MVLDGESLRLAGGSRENVGYFLEARSPRLVSNTKTSTLCATTSRCACPTAATIDQHRGANVSVHPLSSHWVRLLSGQVSRADR